MALISAGGLSTGNINPRTSARLLVKAFSHASLLRSLRLGKLTDVTCSTWSLPCKRSQGVLLGTPTAVNGRFPRVRCGMRTPPTSYTLRTRLRT